MTEQAGLGLDPVVDNRYTEISTIDENVQFTEKRELVPGTNTVLSYASYRGNDAIDGTFVFNVASFVTEHRAVELDSFYSAGVRRALSGGDELARSLKPLTTKESALARIKLRLFRSRQCCSSRATTRPRSVLPTTSSFT